MTAAIDPWAGISVGPQTVTREERVRDAALLLWDTAVESTAEAERLAHRILNITYPEVYTAEQIEALAAGSTIINEAGRVEIRELSGGFSRDSGTLGFVGTDQVWRTLVASMRTGKEKRSTSKQLAAMGPWTVIRRVHA